MIDRQRRILARLVAEYIEQGSPVSSAWLAEHSDLGLSSATVRNILSRLEEQGLVRQPHTSAGRIPTDSGYRMYVDDLLASRPAASATAGLEARLRSAGTVGDILEHASQELSRVSRNVAFALAPASPSARLQHIDFIALERQRVLVIVVTTGGAVTHKVIDTTEDVNQTTLLEAANYVNAEFTGLTLHEIRASIVARMREDRMVYDALMKRALHLAQNGLADVNPTETLHVQGASLLMDDLSMDAAERDRMLAALRVIFRMIEEKHQLVELLTRSIEADGLTVVIGSEHTAPELHPFSIVASTFHDSRRAGTVGVIGPTRMRYERAISAVDDVAQTVRRLLEGQ
jgi:heat-inducible transcriptional repressor